MEGYTVGMTIGMVLRVSLFYTVRRTIEAIEGVDAGWMLFGRKDA